MRIPEDVHPFILKDLFDVIDDAVSDMPIEVFINDVTVPLDDTPILDRINYNGIYGSIWGRAYSSN